jgi:hypothetical protein
VAADVSPPALSAFVDGIEGAAARSSAYSSHDVFPSHAREVAAFLKREVAALKRMQLQQALGLPMKKGSKMRRGYLVDSASGLGLD